jgi:hypothetical protein
LVFIETSEATGTLLTGGGGGGTGGTAGVDDELPPPQAASTSEKMVSVAEANGRIVGSLFEQSKEWDLIALPPA